MDEYVDKSGRAMLAVALTFDLARSAEKMSEWKNLGDDNEAWKEGPYISAPVNHRQIDRNFPYCISTSKAHRAVMGIVMGQNPERAENGGVEIPLPPQEKHSSRVEPVISKLAIIEQFELFKEFLETFDGPFNKQQRKKWEAKASEELLDFVETLTNRRNELTHETDYELPSMKEAVEYFYMLREVIAPQLYEIANKSVQPTANVSAE